MPTANFYGLAFVSAFNKLIDFDTDDIKIMLCTSAYTPNQDTHQFKSSVTNEVSGTGYTAGGLTLTGESITYTAGTNVLKLDADDAAWPGATITARHAVIYDNTPATDATKPLIAYITFDSDVSSTAATFTVAFHADGIATVTVA